MIWISKTMNKKMDLKKAGQFIYASTVGIVCIMIGLFQYVNNNEITLKDIAILALLCFVSIKRTVDLNIFLRLLRVKKKIDLNKIFFLMIILVASTMFIIGCLYNYFCTEKIEVREQHLIAVEQMLTPPENAVKIREELLHKAIARKNFVEYKYESSTDKVLPYYIKEFPKRGYKIKSIGKKEITASKDGVIVNVRYETNKIFMNIRFDDLFERLNI